CDFFFRADDGIRDGHVTGVQTCALPIFAALLATLVLFGLVAWLEGRAIVGAVQRLVHAANAIARGDLARRVPVHGRDELAVLARSEERRVGKLVGRSRLIATSPKMSFSS